MSLFLVIPGHDISIELPVSEALEQALSAQWARLGEPGSRERFSKQFGKRVAELIPESVDWDIKAPTAAQLAYALVLARKAGISIPAEAAASRLHMHLFISELAPTAVGAERTGKRAKRRATRASRL